MRNLALVDLKVTQPIFAALQLPERQIEKLLELCTLPVSVMETQKGVMPLHAVERFLDEIQRKVGDTRYFAHTVARFAEAEPGSVANVDLPLGLTGFEAAIAFAGNTSACLRGASFFLRIEGDRIWFLRTANSTVWTNSWAVQLYNLSIVLRGLQSLWGEGIAPVAFCASDPPHHNDLPDQLNNCEVRISRDEMGLAFLRADLANLTGQSKSKDNFNELGGASFGADVSATDIRAVVDQMLKSFEGQLPINHLARSFGLSERSYRRQLDGLGITHKQLVSDTRLSLAVRKLRDPSSNITQIGLELGFQNPPAFSRFFAGRMGMTPSEFRQAAQI